MASCLRTSRFIRFRPKLEKLAPQLHGFGYVVIEELFAIVEPRTRRIEMVFPRWGRG